MKNLLATLWSMFTPEVKTTHVNSVYDLGFKEESAELAAKRAAAQKNLETWGRKPLLKGGAFSRNNSVLRTQDQS
jgi:hypothetical protein